MIPFDYVYAVWSFAFLVPWLVPFIALPQQRRPMLGAGLLTAPLGLNESLFVPRAHPLPTTRAAASGSA